MTSDTEIPTPDRPVPPQWTPKVISFLKSPAVKFVLIGFVTLMLMIPTTFVWVLVEERADRAREVARDIAASWGGAQEINGPYLAVPFTETYTVVTGEKARTQIDRHLAVFFPERLDVAGDIAVEERQKSIYSLPVYRGELVLSGRFAAPDETAFGAEHGGSLDIHANKAVLVMGIGDVRALKSEVTLGFGNGQSSKFEPGSDVLTVSPSSFSRGAVRPSGINASVPPLKWRKGFQFNIALQLNGSTSLFVAPAGQTTKVTLRSDWPHPGFTGSFLPEQRTISETGFDATWTIPYLARGIPKVWSEDHLPLQDRMMGVQFVEPVNFYQTISRSLKYAIGFISLIFLAVFVLELQSGWRVHWIQYGLVGLALIIFYVMLLAFAEHVGYSRAYLIAASAATTLNAFYIGTSLKSRVAGLVMFAVLAGIFAVLFALMREQDYALLIGSVIAFVALAITMFATQKIDWTGMSPGAARSDGMSA
ncbi:cell envelope integrity protein CreD [Roseibium sp.]|uniref:cell envelope integrity protein CreD n=1 Tax=Roseibium sp. TaxID=1936156 RepID=UPI0039F05EFC